MNSIGEMELEKFHKNALRVEQYKGARTGLLESGITNILRLFARPFSHDRGANPYSAAYSAAFAEGYNAALDQVMYFTELFPEQKVKGEKVQPDFGGLALAYSRGMIRETDNFNGGGTKNVK